MYDNSTRFLLRQKVQTHPDGRNEYWRDLPNFIGFYRVSNWGRLKSLSKWVKIGTNRRFIPGRMMKLREVERGYFSVKISKHGKSRVCQIHTLVLEAFVGPCPEGMECRHLDGNPSNNHLKNLRWGTYQENADDRIRHGTWCHGETMGWAKLKDSDIPKIHRLYDSGMTCEEVAKVFGITGGNVKMILNGKTFRHCQPKVMAKIRPAGFQAGNQLWTKRK
jgi:hypothetical protein